MKNELEDIIEKLEEIAEAINVSASTRTLLNTGITYIREVWDRLEYE